MRTKTLKAIHALADEISSFVSKNDSRSFEEMYLAHAISWLSGDIDKTVDEREALKALKVAAKEILKGAKLK